MRHEDHRAAALPEKVLKQVEEFAFQDHVEVGERLVEEDGARFEDEGAGGEAGPGSVSRLETVRNFPRLRRFIRFYEAAVDEQEGPDRVAGPEEICPLSRHS